MFTLNCNTIWLVSICILFSGLLLLCNICMSFISHSLNKPRKPVVKFSLKCNTIGLVSICNSFLLFVTQVDKWHTYMLNGAMQIFGTSLFWMGPTLTPLTFKITRMHHFATGLDPTFVNFTGVASFCYSWLQKQFLANICVRKFVSISLCWRQIKITDFFNLFFTQIYMTLFLLF